MPSPTCRTDAQPYNANIASPSCHAEPISGGTHSRTTKCTARGHCRSHRHSSSRRIGRSTGRRFRPAARRRHPRRTKRARSPVTEQRCQQHTGSHVSTPLVLLRLYPGLAPHQSRANLDSGAVNAAGDWFRSCRRRSVWRSAGQRRSIECNSGRPRPCFGLCRGCSKIICEPGSQRGA